MMTGLERLAQSTCHYLCVPCTRRVLCTGHRWCFPPRCSCSADRTGSPCNRQHTWRQMSLITMIKTKATGFLRRLSHHREVRGSILLTTTASSICLRPVSTSDTEPSVCSERLTLHRVHAYTISEEISSIKETINRESERKQVY